MSLKELLEKFATGFSVKGIYLQTSQELIPIVQESSELLLMLKRHPNLPDGIINLLYEEQEIGTLVETLENDIKLIILTDSKHIQEVSANWKRFTPIIKKQMDIEQFLNQESVETRLINRLEDIRISIEKSTSILKEKINHG
ncbi:hypothetical protein [Candidatus Hodarchaeum mangrovi]